MPAPPPSQLPKQYLFEFEHIGNTVRVTVIDPESGLEAVIQGPASAGELVLKRAAVQKLTFLRRKRLEGR